MNTAHVLFYLHTALDSLSMRDETHDARMAIAAAIREIETAPPHVCSLPTSIQEALNSGDGTYRP